MLITEHAWVRSQQCPLTLINPSMKSPINVFFGVNWNLQSLVDNFGWLQWLLHNQLSLALSHSCYQWFDRKISWYSKKSHIASCCFTFRGMLVHFFVYTFQTLIFIHFTQEWLYLNHVMTPLIKALSSPPLFLAGKVNL